MHEEGAQRYANRKPQTNTVATVSIDRVYRPTCVHDTIAGFAILDAVTSQIQVIVLLRLMLLLLYLLIRSTAYRDRAVKFGGRSTKRRGRKSVKSEDRGRRHRQERS